MINSEVHCYNKLRLNSSVSLSKWPTTDDPFERSNVAI